MKLLDWLDSSSNNGALIPDLITYNSVLSAFGRSSTISERSNSDTGDVTCVGEEAEKLLRRMEKMSSLKPNKLSYTGMFLSLNIYF
jgi:hypothetical protein